jgi:DNA-binding CsgD family transcriptional regulator
VRSTSRSCARKQTAIRWIARAVATATQTVLATLAGEQPTVLAVDDAQWLDGASDAALRFALRRLDDSPIGVLCAVRAADRRPDTFELALAEPRRFDLNLAPLSLAAIHEVIAARLGQSLQRSVLVRLVELSGGNAFYALEIARELLRRGGAASELPIPSNVHALVETRVGRLPDASREALLLAAALAVPTTALVPEDDLAAAEEAGLVRLHGDGRIRFEHPLVAAAVYESASLSERRRAHRMLAPLVLDKEERARHLALATAGPDESVAVELDAAGAHAAARGASAAAAELARLALDLTESAPAQAFVERSLAAAHYLLDSGDSAAARAVLETCDPQSVEGDVRARLLGDLGYVLWYEGDSARGYDLLLEGLRHTRDPEVAARTHGFAAWLSQDVDLERAIAHDDAAVSLLDPERTPGRYSWSLLHGAYLRLLNGEGADDDAYERGRVLQQRVVDWDDTSPVLGMWPVFKDDFAAARAFYEPGLERSRAEGDETSVQGTLLRLAEMACWTGDWVEADRLASEGVSLADRVGASTYLGSALFARGLLDAHLGRAEQARAAAQRILGLFSAGGPSAALGEWVLGFVDLSLGDAAAADVHYSNASAHLDALAQREPARFRFHPDHVEAVVLLGDLERAEALLAALEARAAVFPRPWILATGARCRALVCAARGDLAGALAAAEEALQHHDRLDMPFERARTLVVAGTILRRLKRKRRAREAFEEALVVFERLGAEPWSRATANELARVAARRAPAGLTATELQIASLAAAGHSNPEIAAQVFVSRKTVEANLARVYRKLGISSRVQLARALDREAGAIT